MSKSPVCMRGGGGVFSIDIIIGELKTIIWRILIQEFYSRALQIVTFKMTQQT